MRTERILDRIETAFADAVEDGGLDEAEGWIAVAAWVRSRSATLAPVSGRPLVFPSRRPRTILPARSTLALL
jgi:hypothetical protein